MTEFSDYIVYVDESGDANLQRINPDFPLFCLSFCVVKKDSYAAEIVPAFQKFKFKYFGHDLIVLHEHDIRKSKGPFTLLMTSATLRKSFYDDLNTLMGTSEIRLIAGVIRKEAHLEKYANPYDPYRLALFFCMEQLLDLLLKRGQAGKHIHVLFESRGKLEDRELEASFRRICDNQERIGKGLFRQRDFGECNFEPIFAPKSCNSTGLQLADLTARPIALKTLRPGQANRAYEIIEPKLTKKVFPHAFE